MTFRTSVRWLAAAASLAWPLVASASEDKPQYGGTLNIGTVYVALPPVTWNPADWSWKFQHDTGLMYEQLFVGDLSKSERRGGRHPFRADAWLPSDAIRGELAERWAWKDKPLRVEIRLRKGVKFPDKPGVMKSRELVAQDVVDSFERLNASPRKNPGYFDHVEKVEASDRYTVVFTMNAYSADWDFRFGWGFFSGIVPREVVEKGASDWRNANGSGPFVLADYLHGSAVTYSRNPIYWDSERIAGQDFKLPFVDRIVYRTIRDESTFLAALRTGKLDVLEWVRAGAVGELKRNAPALQFKRGLETAGTFLAMRTDTKPFDDIRVRRALNMAIDKKEIVESFYNGDAELFAYPMDPSYVGYYEPLDQMPKAVRELFEYDPGKARALLAEAGYPKGFNFKVQVCSCVPGHLDLLALVAAYLEKVGVGIEIQPMEFGPFMSVMTTRTHAPGFLLRSGHSNPMASLRKNFLTGQPYNPSQYSDPGFDRRIEQLFLEPDEGKRQQRVRLMTRDIVEKAPYVWLPVQYLYTAWWPWVRNYGGELRAGAERPGPIHARIWIDREQKRRMGF